MFHNYLVNINTFLNLCDEEDEEVTKIEAEKRETVYYSVMELLNKFESSVTNANGNVYMFSSVFVGPSRSFNPCNYSISLPCVQMSRAHSYTTVGDLIQSYKHHIQRPDLEIGSLLYDGVEYLPYVLIKNMIHKKLRKHFFYFHHDIPDDGRNIEDLLSFIGGEAGAQLLPSASSSSLPGNGSSTPKIKKKRKKTKGSGKERKTSGTIEIPSRKTSLQPSASFGEVDGARSLPLEEEATFRLAKSVSADADRMKKAWQEFSDQNSAEKNLMEVSREYDFDITEEEGGPNDMSLEKADYLDKLTNVIAAKAKAEWENKKQGFEKLHQENEIIQSKIKIKDKELEDHQGKVDELVDGQAKALTKFINMIDKTEDDKMENVKKIGILDKEIEELQEKILRIKDEQKTLKSKTQQFDDQIEKMCKKRQKLEKYMESEMARVKAEGETITNDLDKLKTDLEQNIQATNDLANMEMPAAGAAKVETPNEGTSRLLDFLSASIKEKEADLECPVCLEPADIPIYMCTEMHLICSACKPKVKECPECRQPYTGQPRRHRYAEKTAEELRKLRKELESSQTS